MPSFETTRRSMLTAALAGAVTLAVPQVATAAGAYVLPRRTPGGTTVTHHSWHTAKDWQHGSAQGVRPGGEERPGLLLAEPAGTTEYRDPHRDGATSTWEYATWTSASRALRTPASELITSWNARTPPGTWIRVELRATYTDGTTTPWFTMGVWASGDGDDVPCRTSVDGQSDGRSSVSTDTLVTGPGAGEQRFTAVRLRVTLLRAPGSEESPRVCRLDTTGSDIEDRFEVPASRPGRGGAIELDVPRYSQNVHLGRYPRYDNGGEAWCSPTSTQMIVEYWDRRPDPADLAWVKPEYDDPQICHAARQTYDHTYEGCGNWPFSTAYAATYPGLRATVTRLSSLADAERLVRAGIPLVTSQSFLATELTGAGYGTTGHLMTLIGFTADGDVIANDPNSPDNAAVRRVYRRGEWENTWLRTKRRDGSGRIRSGSGGVCYVIWPARPTAAQRRALDSLGIA
ncbi:C39 family peptidase [Streptomyces sp. 549]|uniref:C39 family peptidase n=1 Tax=Streptomyces sp. 549 TaxID=3049076 RepID=UPI0024C32A7B|nr:C39 family peptidase [Streptomyces sp. 549]MDK1473327.1 C39 family peptidase [Streptomyces sp. 549]